MLPEETHHDAQKLNKFWHDETQRRIVLAEKQRKEIDKRLMSEVDFRGRHGVLKKPSAISKAMPKSRITPAASKKPAANVAGLVKKPAASPARVAKKTGVKRKPGAARRLTR